MFVEAIEDIYPLTPLQDGLLFHALYQPGSPAYFEQLSCRLLGPLDPAVLRQSWQRVVQRHAALRVAFEWEETEQPVQLVFRQVVIPFELADWRHLEGPAQMQALEDLLRRDREQGFDLGKPPLMRLHLVRLAEEEHFFLWSHHHLLLDGWCLPLLLREIFTVYEAVHEGRSAALPRPRPFREYLTWLQQREGDRDRAYWQKALKGVRGPTKVDVLKPSASQGQDGSFAQLERSLPEGVTAELEGLARRLRVTQSTVLQGLWGLLLRHYGGGLSGQDEGELGSDEAIFGITVAGRPADLPGAESMIGLFINTLPLRLQLPAGATLVDWLPAVQRQVAQMREHEHVPLVEVQRWSGLPSGQPLFETLLAYENYPMDPRLLEGTGTLRVRDLVLSEQTHYPLTLTVVPGANVGLRLTWDPRRIEDAAARRLLDHLETLLRAAVERPAARLEDLSPLSAAERRQLLGEWSGPPSDGPFPDLLPEDGATPLPELFARQARSTPNAVAVALGGSEGELRWTYAELAARVEQLAGVLREAGAGRERPVAILLERSPELVAGVLAVLAAGAPYLPLDPEHPAERRAFQLRDSGADLLLGRPQRVVPEEVPGTVRILDVDAIPRLPGRRFALGRAVDPDDLAYVLYTSGSTGRPKGVMVSHRAAARYLAWAGRAYGVAPGRRVLLHSSVAFDLSLTSLLAPLLAGGTVQLAPERGPETLGKSLTAESAADPLAFVKLTPSHLEGLRHSLEPVRLEGRVGTMVLGGEGLFGETLRPWLQALPGVRWINEYGPTEATVACCAHEAQAEDRGAVPIGRAIAGARLYLVDRRLQPVVVGVRGELCIGGEGLARGYLGRPALTAERFIPDPFGSEPGRRLYRTGDVVRRREDGVLVYLGRVDQQVKVRGHRIEPGEVEAVLSEHPEVAEAVVVARDGAAGTGLVAYAVPRKEQAALDPVDLQGWLRHRLPEPMVPAQWVILDRLPLSASGKIDRQALPAPDQQRSAAAYSAPRGPVEEVLAEIWGELLDVPRVGIRDDFFALGGHSLLAMRVVSRLRHSLGLAVHLQDLFEAPTIEALAARLEDSRFAVARLPSGEPERLPRAEREAGTALPLSFSQQRLWFLDRLQPGSSFYNITGAVSLIGRLPTAALSRALNEIVRRHEALRTRLPEVDGHGVQVIDQWKSRPLSVIDLGVLGEERAREEAGRLARREGRRPFDLARGPLLRGCLLRLGATGSEGSPEHRLLLTLHHVIGDGWSVGVLVRELLALVPAFAAGRPSPLPELGLQYADYAVWQRRVLSGPALESQLEYWRRQLAGELPPLSLPTDRPRPPEQTFEGGRRPLGAGWLGRREVELLRELARQERATMFMVLLAGYGALLQRLTGQDDLAVGTPVANRDRPELEGLIGFFVNTLVLRFSAGGDPSFLGLLERVRETALGAFAHRDVPFERLVAELQPDRDLGRSPLFQVMLVLQNTPMPSLNMEGLEIRPLVAEPATAKFDLSLALEEVGSEGGGLRLEGFLAYNRELFESTSAERMVRQLARLLAGAAREPETPLSQLPLLSQGESWQLLGEWNDSARARPAACLHELFERQVERSPEAVAVISDAGPGESLTYRQLDERADLLAWHLQQSGVGPDVPVAIYLHRSVARLVAVLAVLKAGGAYVPLDVDYPPERLKLLLDDAAALLVLGRRSDGADAGKLGLGNWRWLDLDDLDREAGRDDGLPRAPIRRGRPENLAYLIYTSGSTGRPKGVMAHHRGVVNRVLWTVETLGVAPGDRLLHKAAFSFDASVWETFAPLFAGATVVLARPAGQRDTAYLVEAVVRHGITLLHFIPSLLQVFLEEEGVERCTSLRWVVCGGEAMTPQLRRRLQARLAASLLNQYGPTETSINALAGLCRRGGDPMRPVSIGRPLPNYAAHVVDRHLCLQPQGVAGELCVGGDGVTRGYWGLPARTARSFVPDPFSGEAGHRLYRTGDLVRRWADGRVEFLGRIDEQVKLRGFRIEPGEIAAVLRQHPGLAQAVVLARPAPTGGLRLVAYVVTEVAEVAGTPPSSGDLQEYLAERLPAHMVPAHFVFLDRLPVSPAGKLDRQALPEPEVPKSAAAETPRGTVEKALADIWREVLGVGEIGREDNFFELGGDSILTIQVVSRARRAGFELTPRQVFQHQTVAALAAELGAAIVQSSRRRPPVEAGPLALTPIQARFFEAQLAEPDHWNQALMLGLRRPLSLAVLQRALDALMKRHDAFSLRFHRTADAAFEGWQQEVVPPESAALHSWDLTGLAPGERDVALMAAAEQVQSSLSLEQGPLLRAVLMELGSAGQRLLLVIHHLAVDGVSWRILLEELEIAYRALEGGTSVEEALGDPPLSYRQWSEVLSARAEAPELRAELEFWSRQPWKWALPRVEQLAAGGGMAGTVVQERRLEESLSADETRDLLQRMPAAWRVRPDEVVLAALAIALGRRFGAVPLRIDLEGHGREEELGADPSQTVGWCTAVFPVLLPAVPNSATDPGAVLQAVKETLRRVPRGGVDFGILRHLFRNETAQTLHLVPPAALVFNYLGRLDNALPEDSLWRAADESPGPDRGSANQRLYPVEVVASVLNGRLRLWWIHTAGAEAAVKPLAQDCLAALRRLLAECTVPGAGGRTPTDFPLARLDQAEVDRLVGTGNEVEDLYPLSPLQQGLLFQTRMDPHSGVYFQQLHCVLRGDLDEKAFERAWQRVVEHHEVLRTAFVWEGLDEPLQVVHRRAQVSCLREDWSDLREVEETQRLDAFLVGDRRRGFDLDQAPLMRLALLRRGPRERILVWSHHHLLLDGWCVPRILLEVFHTYAEITGRGATDLPPLPPPAPPLREYIAWLQRQDAEAAEAFWRERLEGFSSVTPLPFDRPAARTVRGPVRGKVERLLGLAETELLGTFARRLQLTVGTLAHGTWALLLGHHGGGREALFGAVVSGRPPELPGSERIVGMLINTLPARVALPQDLATGTWLRTLQEELAQLRQYEYSSLAQLQGLSGLPAGSPLFESLLVVENQPADALPAAAAGIEITDSEVFEFTGYPLTAAVVPQRQLRLRLEYDEERFDQTTAARLLRHMARLLRQLVMAEERPLGEIPRLEGAEWAQVLVEWNDSQRDFAAERSLRERLRERAHRAPQAVAVVADDAETAASLTYGELETEGGQLARRLRQAGVGPETVVGIFLERSISMVVALRAVIEAGGAFLPLDPDAPSGRLSQQLEEAAPRVILSHEALVSRLPASSAVIWTLDDSASEGQEAEVRTQDRRPERPCRSEALAYVLYTSGSTGRPKAVMVSHRALLNRLLWAERSYPVTAADRVLQLAPLIFDFAVWECLAPLLAGGQLVLARPDGHRDPAYLLEAISVHDVTLVHFTPSTLQILLEEEAIRSCQSLRYVMVGGEELPAALRDRCLDRLPGTVLLNQYGPTEACIDATAAIQNGAAAGPASIGRPVDNTAAYVADRWLRPVPLGANGELLLAGMALARGYLKQPRQTAERFVPDPWSALFGGRLYRTGDRVRWRGDGELQYLGRLDAQIQLRGVRLELGEVEAALRRYPQVAEAAVLAVGDDPLRRQLVACLVPQIGSESPAPDDLRSFLADRLPRHVIPAVFLRVDALPLTPTGKLDRRRLEATAAGALQEVGPGESPTPRSPEEEVLAAIFQELLAVERVGIHDDFFALGGHSLLATQAISRIREAFAVDLPLRSLFDAPTVAALGQQVVAWRHEHTALLPAPPLTPSPVRSEGDEVVLSFAQERLWFLDHLAPENPFYNLASAVVLRGQLRTAALAAALAEILRRHEVLRTAVATKEGQPRAQVVSASTVARAARILPLVDLCGLVPSRRQQEARRLTAGEARRPFRLDRPPLLRSTLLRLAPTEHQALLTLHHIVSDAWSAGILIRELTTLYQAFSRGVPSPLGDLPLQYQDFARWQRTWLTEGGLAEQIDYWRRQLGGGEGPLHLPVLHLPWDRPRPPVPSFRGARYRYGFGRQLMAELRELARQERATLFMVLLASFQVLVGRLSGQREVLVGSPVANRNCRKTEGLIGFFVNNLVLRGRLATDSGGDLSFRRFLRHSRDTALEAYAHQDVPFEKLVDLLQPDRDLSRAPLFQVVLVLQNTPLPALALSGLELEVLERPGGSAKFDLTLSFAETSEGLEGELEYSTDLFDRTTALRLMASLEALLTTAVADPEQGLWQLGLLTQVERHQIVHELGAEGTLEGGSPAGLLHDLFAARVWATPEAVAVSYEGKSWTYEELERRARMVAGRLVDAGVVPGVRVGLCAERSLGLVAAIIGILQAGAAYVPLDPSLPQERLRFLLQDSDVRAIVTVGEVADQVPHVERPVLALEEEDPVPGGPLQDLTSLGDLPAYVIYTSGSTGQPKGVVVRHGNVIRLLRRTETFFGFGPSDVWTLFHSYAFDFSVWELWGALLYGGRLVVVPYLTSRAPEAVYRLLLDEGVTVLNQTPSAFRQLIAAQPALPEEAGDLALRWVIFGGEALDFAVLRPWFDRHGHHRPRLVNMYGITETTVHVTLRSIEMRDVEQPASAIGRPISDLDALVLDSHGGVVPLGVAGELCISGPGLAVGYLGRPALTAERFVPHGWTARPGERLYRSGDLGRWSPRGELEYLGRIDHQVKVRGFRIETGEIESALAAHPGVREAVVVARKAETPAEAGETFLVAYVAGSAEALGTESLRSFLRQRLPDYMVPAAIVLLEHLPLTPNGKVDRRALPRPKMDRRLEQSYVAPRSAREHVLARIWEEVLGVTAVGVHDNFFALGGDSILSIRILARAREEGLDLSLPELFERPTIAELAAIKGSPTGWLERGEPFTLVTAEDRKALGPDIADAYPLTRLQAGMLFHSSYREGAAAYHNVSLVRLALPFDEDALRTAGQDLLARHGVLRTSFDLTSFSEPLQQVHSQARLPLQVTDLRSLNAAEQEAELERWFVVEKRHPFDWRRPPLLRVTVHRLEDRLLAFGLTEHHAILDGWSVASLRTELLLDYQARLEGRQPQRPPVTASFGDFVALEREALSSAETRAFWGQYLKDAPFLQLSPLLPQEAESDREASGIRRLTVPISPDLAAGLQRLAEELGVPLKSVLLAAHLRVLAVHGAQEDVVTGIVTSGRPEGEGGERVLGLFLNTLPLRLRLGRGSWQALVQRSFEAEGRLLAHRRMPLAEIQKLQGGRVLFATAFNFTHFHVFTGLGELQDLVQGGGTDFAETEIPLMVHFSRPAGSRLLGLELLADRQTFGGDLLQRLSHHFAGVLTEIARRPEGAFHLHSCLSATENAWLVRDLNDRPAIYPESTIPQQFAFRASEEPAAPVVEAAGQTLRRGELEEKANRLANHLRQLGVRRGDLVGIHLERSLEMVVALLAVLKAGAAYVPLDPGLPAARLAFMLEDAAAPVVISREELAAALPGGRGRIVRLDQDEEQILRQPATVPAVPLEPEDLAYVTYTSGSTGRPKGVQVPHRGVMRLLFAADYADFSRRAVLQLSPLTFDLSTLEIWAPLLRGGRCVLMPAGKPTVAVIAETIRRYRADTAWLTGSLFNAVVDEDPQALAGLEQLLVGGEALSVPHVRRALEVLPTLRLINGYGPTENTTFTACHPILHEGIDERQRSIPIGSTLPGTTVYVLDRHGVLVPSRVAGELHTGGAGLARGYHRRPALTAERFVPDPFADIPGQRLYRTGDLVRVLPSGLLDFVGRVDQQVKVRGFRIELGEIEACLAEHPAIRSAAVVVHRSDQGSQRLLAYFSANEELSAESLQTFLAQRLPHYMVPGLFQQLAAMPLNPAGKIDRQKLPEPVITEPTAIEPTGGTAPVTAEEQALAEIWQRLLGCSAVRAEDNFLELGGDSILALQLVARAAQAGLVLTPADVFEQPTLRQLAVVARREKKDEDPAQVDLQVPVTGEGPLTPIQSWWVEQDLTNPHQWNQAVLLHVEGRLNLAALDRAIGRLLEHHDALRLRLVQQDGTGEGQWRQHFESPGGVLPWVCRDLSALPAERRPAAVTAVATAAQASLNVFRGPVLRVVYLDLGPREEGRLLLVIHHMAVDGVSWRILLEDLGSTYEQACSGVVSIKLPARTRSFLEWAEHLQRLSGETSPDDLAFWLEQPWKEAANLPRDLTRGRNTHASSRVVTAALSEGATAALLHGRRQEEQVRSGIDAVLLAALGRAVAPWLGGGALLVDLEGHGRPSGGELDLSRTVGWFTSFHPLLVPTVGGDSALQDLRAHLEVVSGQPAYPRSRQLTYGLLRFLNPDPRIRQQMTNLPRAEVVFNYLGQLDRVLPIDGLLRVPGSDANSLENTGPGRSPEDLRAYVLEVNARVTGGRLQVGWTYSQALHRRQTIEALAQRFVEELESLLTSSTFMPRWPLVRQPANRDRLDEWRRQGFSAEDAYPLSPTQLGMLSVSLQEGSEAGTYISQLSCLLEVELEPADLAACWLRLQEHHSILRTAFLWEDPEELLQVVRSKSGEPAAHAYQEEDWSNLAPTQQKAHLAGFLEADRRRGFDLRRSPLARLSLCRLGRTSYRAVWSFHHLILDGWSTSMLLRDFLALVQGRLEGHPVELVVRPSYRDYVVSLQGRDEAEAEGFWRRQLAGFVAPTPLPFEQGRGSATAGEHYQRLDSEQGTALERFTREHRLTLNTVLQGAWAIVLGHLSEAPADGDVLFGTTVAGRPPELPGVEQMLGLFIGTLPLRLQLTPEERLVPWLQRIQQLNLEIRRHEGVALSRIMRWSDMPVGQPLFHSLLLFQNYPVDRTFDEQTPGLRFSDPWVESRSDYPLTVRVTPGAGFLVEVLYRDPADERLAQRVLGLLLWVLEGFIADPQTRLEDQQDKLRRSETAAAAKARNDLKVRNLQRLKGRRRHA